MTQTSKTRHIQVFQCGVIPNRKAVIGNLYRESNGYTLILKGSGPVRAPKSGMFHGPWGRHAEEIRRVEIGEGITEIESGAFAGLHNLESAYFP